MPASQFAPKRQIDANSANKEIKRMSTHINGKIAANVAAIATADAVDPATTMALVNINKAKINAVIAALVAAGLMN